MPGSSAQYAIRNQAPVHHDDFALTRFSFYEAGENPDLVSVLLLRVDIDIAIYAVNQKLLNPCRKQHPERQGDPADEISTDQS